MPPRPAPTANAIPPVPGVASARAAARTTTAASPATCDTAITVNVGSRRALTPPRKSPTPHDRLAARASVMAITRWRSLHGPGGGDRVELIRVVEDGRLRRPGGAGVVVARDRVQKLGARLRVEAASALVDQAQAEVDVSEQAPLPGRPEHGSGRQLAGSSDVVDERGGE